MTCCIIRRLNLYLFCCIYCHGILCEEIVMSIKLQMVSFWEQQIFQPLISYSLSDKQRSNIRPIVCTWLHITTSKQGNMNYWPQKHKTLHLLLGKRYRGLSHNMRSSITCTLERSLHVQLDVAGHCLVEFICSAVCFVDSIVHACFFQSSLCPLI